MRKIPKENNIGYISGVAQLEVRLPSKQEVLGSIPSIAKKPQFKIWIVVFLILLKYQR
jgi:hypothetical protein